MNRSYVNEVSEQIVNDIFITKKQSTEIYTSYFKPNFEQTYVWCLRKRFCPLNTNLNVMSSAFTTQLPVLSTGIL